MRRTCGSAGLDMAQCNSPGRAFMGLRRIATARSPLTARGVAHGVNHIDTSDFYGPHVTNEIIREALHPYPEGLVIVTKVGFRRGHGRLVAAGAYAGPADGRPWRTTCGNLGLEALDVVNLRLGDARGPAEAPMAEPLGVLIELKEEGKIRHIGLSNDHARTVRRGLCDDARLRAFRTSTTLRNGPMMPSSTGSMTMACRMCLISRLEALRRYSLRSWTRRRNRWVQRRCRLRWHGCCSDRQTSC